MGLDFIRKCARPFRRSWSRGLDALTTLDLFTRQPTDEVRRFCARPLDGHGFRTGEQHILRAAEIGVDVYAGQTRVGVIESPPQYLLDAIRNGGCGLALGKIEKVHAVSGVGDMCVS